MSAISVTTGPAARGADGIRGSLVGPTRRLGTAKSIHGSALVDATVPRSKLDAYALLLRQRYAAKSLGGASSTAGAFASFNWAPSSDGTEHFRLGFVAANTTPHTGPVRMVGRAAANCANIGITVAGANRKSDIVVYEDSNAKLTATGAYSHDGFPQDVYADITPTTATLYVNGVLVASTTFASVNWSNVAASNYVGALNASGNNRWPGALWNARFIDHMTATNCVWLNMDEPPSLSASYANAYTVPTDPLYNVGTTTPTSANKGTVAAMPWVCAVDSMDGRGMPFQPVGPLIYHAQQGSTQALDGGVAAFTSLQFTGAETDPTGSFTLSNATFFTAPYAGLAVVTLCGGFDGNADVADPITIELRNSGSTFYALQTEGGVLAVPVTYSLRGVSAMTVGQTLGALVNGAAATTTLTLRGHAVTIEFYPTPTTG